MSSTDQANTSTTTLAEANKNHFNAIGIAVQMNQRSDVIEMNRRIAEEVKKVYGKFDPNTTEVLDFACGSGLLSRHLAPLSKSVLGVDISQGMVDVYNEEVSKAGIDPSKVRAMVKDITGAPEELEGRKFDVIVCSMAYHHLSSISATTLALRSHLRPCGSILVIDIHELASDSRAASELKTIHSVNQQHKHGFSEEEFRALFVDEVGIAATMGTVMVTNTDTTTTLMDTDMTTKITDTDMITIIARVLSKSLQEQRLNSSLLWVPHLPRM